SLQIHISPWGTDLKPDSQCQYQYSTGWCFGHLLARICLVQKKTLVESQMLHHLTGRKVVSEICPPDQVRDTKSSFYYQKFPLVVQPPSLPYPILSLMFRS
uniref:Uncharacterized protein n=1 Tax=Spermophilus dauricus TaxID=99837 RepID=A0A8C9PFV0_SPEDA